MKHNVLGVVEEIRLCGEKLLEVLQRGENTAEEVQERVVALPEVISILNSLIPQRLYSEYEEFLGMLSSFCAQCDDLNFLIDNVDNLYESIEVFVECISLLREGYKEKVRKCLCCGKEVVYEERIDGYMCSECGATYEERKMIALLQYLRLQECQEGTRVLHVLPTTNMAKWIIKKCPQIVYETANLFVSDAEYYEDVERLHGFADASYDLIICSDISDNICNNSTINYELRRLLKDSGKVIFSLIDNINIDSDTEENLSETWRVHKFRDEFLCSEAFLQSEVEKNTCIYTLTKTKDVDLSMKYEYTIDKELCKNGPLVSVVMSAYNHGAFVAEAIESVLNQSYKNIEFIVADDCSTDNTAEVMKRYSKHFAQEYYFDYNAGGRYGFLNAQTTGKYIATMNSDDIWEPDKLAIQVAYMEEHPECGACFTWCNYINEDYEEIEGNIFIQKNRSQTEWMSFFWNYENALCNPSSLIRREWRIRKSRYGTACWQLPDFFWWVDLIQCCEFYIVPKVLIKMRRHQKNNVGNVSLVSEETMIRGGIEEGANWLNVIRDMDAVFFGKVFKDSMKYPNATAEIEIKCEKYFVLLQHKNLFVQNSAFIYLHENYNEIQQCLKTKYKYSHKQLKEDCVCKGLATYFLQ